MTKQPGRGKLSPARLAVFRALGRIGSDVLDPTDPHSPARFDELDPRDSPLAEKLYRTCVENLRLLDSLIEKAKVLEASRTPAPLRRILRMVLCEWIFLAGAPDYAIGQQGVELARKAEGEKAARFLNATTRRLFERFPRPHSPPSTHEELDAWLTNVNVYPLPIPIRYSVPDDIAKMLSEAYGGDALGACLRNLTSPERVIYLRVNQLKSSVGEAMDALLALEIKADGVAGLPGAICAQEESGTVQRLIESEIWHRGVVTIQGLGAQTVAHFLAPEPGESVLDFCAAPGGKTAQIWEMMNREGRLVAHEINEARHGNLKETLMRLHELEPRVEIVGSIDAIHGEFNAVLVDAPCLGLGLIGEHPEIRWDNRLRRLGTITKKQGEILCEAAKFVRPGGRLVWSTCSPTREENEGILRNFFSENDNFVAQSNPVHLSVDWIEKQELVFRTRPDRRPVEGFAVGTLNRWKH